ncbi:MAG: M14 family zinc carboxypeptidase [Actinomycetes bacterium]
MRDPVVHRRVVVGHSVNGRPLLAYEVGDADSARRILIVGCIHGDERAGIAIADGLIASTPSQDLDLWVVPVLNPDGAAAGTRVNGRGVDLNRNFPYRWRRLGPLGTPHYSGPAPLSEPETRAALALLKRIGPSIGVWYHQALAVVDDSQGPLAFERRYATLVGLPLRKLADYPGSAVGEEDHLLGPTAFVVELPAGALSATQVRQHERAVLDLAALLPPG